MAINELSVRRTAPKPRKPEAKTPWFCGKYPVGEHVVTLSNGQTAVVAFEQVAK